MSEMEKTVAVETETGTSEVGEGNLDVTVDEFYKPLMINGELMRMKEVREFDFVGVLDDRYERFKRAKVDDDVSDALILEALIDQYCYQGEEIDTKSGWIETFEAINETKVDLNSMPKQSPDAAPAERKKDDVHDEVESEEEKLDMNVGEFYHPLIGPNSGWELSRGAE